MPKGFAVVYILVGILILGIVGGAFYLGRITSNLQLKTLTTNPGSKFSPSPSSKSLNTFEKEINDFPVYPGSKFIEKKDAQTECGMQGDKKITCPTVLYIWETSDHGDKVRPYFGGDRFSSGWKCNGGLGWYSGPNELVTESICLKGSLAYNLNITASLEKSKIELKTLVKTSDQNLDETDNWEIYQSDAYKFTIKYPSDVIHETKIVADLGPGQIDNLSHEYFKKDDGILEIYGLCGRGVTPIKQYDLYVGGQKTTKFYETNTKGVLNIIYRPNSINGVICFNFQLPSSAAKSQKVDALFDQILSTFKFLPVSPAGGDQNDKITCTSNSDCVSGFSCWYQVPRGPAAGIRGTKENPGQCIEDKIVNQMQ